MQRYSPSQVYDINWNWTIWFEVQQWLYSFLWLHLSPLYNTKNCKDFGIHNHPLNRSKMNKLPQSTTAMSFIPLISPLPALVIIIFGDSRMREFWWWPLGCFLLLLPLLIFHAFVILSFCFFPVTVTSDYLAMMMMMMISLTLCTKMLAALSFHIIIPSLSWLLLLSCHWCWWHLCPCWSFPWWSWPFSSPLVPPMVSFVGCFPRKGGDEDLDLDWDGNGNANDYEQKEWDIWEDFQEHNNTKHGMRRLVIGGVLFHVDDVVKL